MSQELVLLASADADIQTAYEYYEHSQPGRGDVFLSCLDAALGRLRIFPEIAPVIHGSYRRLLVANFPYGIFYSLEGGRLIVIAVMDLRRDPQSVLRRLRGPGA